MFLVGFTGADGKRGGEYFTPRSIVRVLTEMLALTNGRFRINSINYMGGIAFYLIYNSLIFRIPVSMKKYIAQPLFALERLMGSMPGKFLYSSFIGQWIKN